MFQESPLSYLKMKWFVAPANTHFYINSGREMQIKEIKERMPVQASTAADGPTTTNAQQTC